MHPYLPHLLDDIKNAHRIEQLGITPCEKSFEEEMEEIVVFARSLSASQLLRKEPNH